ncbi:MAG: general secretion pathway protein J [Pseudomonadales bacterium]|jgi:general secretion pathway protein J
MSSYFSPRQSVSQVKSLGFTLIEMLVALSIFALISVGAYQILSRTIFTQQVLSGKAVLDNKERRLEWLMARDFQALLGEKARYLLPLNEQPLVLENGVLLSVVRTAENVPGVTTSALKRISYVVKNVDSEQGLVDAFVREAGFVIAEGAERMQHQVIMADIEFASWRIKGSDGKWYDNWPVEEDDYISDEVQYEELENNNGAVASVDSEAQALSSKNEKNKKINLPTPVGIELTIKAIDNDAQIRLWVVQ